MKNTLLAAALALASAVVLAQGPGSGPGGGGPGPGGGPGKGPAWKFGPGNTGGWSLMTPKERTEHRDKMLGMKTVAECKAYLEEQRKQLEARAKEKGRPIPAGPRQDMCERMKQAGRLG